ncbi:MAG: beta-ketoacyl-ACP synthase II [Pirellulales bacterium]|jgi:3-oxoacyl-[acyl-carrier-protein] synthase II|nr:beta-ketoacyl-ACP synthase II [Thermoguttaceae bacterium]MDD4789372.1 beta-ketoacyl-ACP synthase II [Pirellulales bacterium]MDI9445512.1 beta-ketoacyl-ACP synthase II [Planctomycetota bacterium]NLY99559.1 beta-ketoacyl-ACP synthase II [Pirellulaceae bacterium]
MKRRVVITGLGVVSPLGCDLEDVWVRICNGESGVRAIEDFDCSQFRSRIGGKVLNWSCDGYLPTKEAKRLDRFAQFAVVAAIDAVKHSGLDTSREDPYRCGVIIGSGVGGLREIEVQHTRLLEKGPDKVSAFTIPKMMLNAASGHVSIQFGLRGPNAGVATACASASNAMADAVKAIQYGEAEVIITGGSEAAVTPMGMSAFCALRALSERNDQPARASRPFDRGRDGFVLSEGAGILVLEELEHARRRRATILAEMLGCGVSADGGHITQPDPNGIGAAKAMELALKDARIAPADVDYINAHGTSTPLGDKAETQAIRSVFGEDAKSISISSTKSQLGHSLGASGGIEMALSVLALNRGLIPPTINYETPDPDCDLDYTPNVPRERGIQVVMSNSFGFGGHNVSLVAGTLRNGS